MGGIFSQMDESGFVNVWSWQSHGADYLYFLLWKPAQSLVGSQPYFMTLFSILWYLLSIGFLFLGFYYFHEIIEHVWGAQKALMASVVYMLLALAVEWYVVVDSITITGLLGAIYYVIQGKSVKSGVLLGTTATLKPMGLILLPVVLKSEFISWKNRITFIITALIVYIALLLPFVFGNFKIFMSALSWQSGRPPWETWYSFILWLTKTPFPLVTSIYMDYSGIAPRDWGWTGLTPMHSIMTNIVPTSTSWYNLVFMVLIAVLISAFLLTRRVVTPVDLLWSCLCLLTGYFVAFYGWSAQFYFWLVPFLLGCFPMIVSVAMRILTLLEYPVFYGLYLARIAPDLVPVVLGLTANQTNALAVAGPPGYWGSIVLRTMIFILFGVIAWRKLPGHFWWREWQWHEILA
jgi:hypothetical protein